MIEECKRDLPNFPEEIIDLWLAPFVETEGWPPCNDHAKVPGNRWRYLLGEKPVTYWENIQWEKEELDLAKLQLTGKSAATIQQLVAGYVLGQENMYTQTLGQNGKDRFDRVFRYLIENGTLPAPPIIINEGDDGYTVVDGNHRIAAFLGWFHLRNNKKFLETITTEVAELKTIVPVWVGTTAQQVA